VRVLLWSELFWPYIGGAERFLASLATTVTACGCDCLVVTSHHDRDLPDEDTFEGIPVRRLPFRSAFGGGRVGDFASLTGRTARLRREFGADLVHLNAVGPSAWFLLKTMQADGAPLLATLQQEVLPSQQQPSGSLLERVLDAAQWVVGCSPTVLRQARALRPAISQRSSCIYNGTVIPDVAPLPLPATPHILSVGRLVPAKAVDVTIRAAAALTSQFPELRLTIAGDGTERARLQQLAFDLHIADRVVFPGWIDPKDLPALMNTATVVVIPSQREGLGLVAVEAGVMGRPVIASRVGGLADLILDGETGLLIAPDAPDGFARGIARVLSDPAMAAPMGARAREHVKSLVSWDEIVSAYNRLYTVLTARSVDR
jgi:glycosyltransferase involved in cell wall biosynthesis